MKQITYTVTDPLGLHARPAGMLVKKSKEFSSAITLTKADKTVDARKLFAVMSLGVKGQETITLAFDGADEDAAANTMEAFLKEHL